MIKYSVVSRITGLVTNSWTSDLFGEDHYEPSFGQAEDYYIVQEDMNSLLNQWIEVRNLRDTLLSRCDWTQLSDSPFSSEQKQLWRAYRQALRDLPQQSGDPENITWPEAPEM